MDPRIENFRRRSSHFARDEREASRGVDWRFVFGEHDQSRTGSIQPRIHSGSDFHPASEGETNVDAVVHTVGGKGAPDFVDYLFVRRNFRERKCGGGTKQALEMLVELEDTSIVKAQSFPDRVAALHRRIEWTDPGLVAMDEAAVDVDDQVAILLVKLLEHN